MMITVPIWRPDDAAGSGSGGKRGPARRMRALTLSAGMAGRYAIRTRLAHR